jgi:hypothetical protein
LESLMEARRSQRNTSSYQYRQSRGQQPSGMAQPIIEVLLTFTPDRLVDARAQ